MFGYIYQNDSQWFPNCMEVKEDHFYEKNEVISHFIEDCLYSFLKSFQYQHPQEILDFFQNNRSVFIPYEDLREIYLDDDEVLEIYEKIKPEREDLIASAHLAYPPSLHYNSEVSLFISNKLPYLLTSPDINIFNTADPFAFVFNFNRQTFELYLYKHYPNFVLDQDFYSDKENEKYHPTLILRLKFEDIFMRSFTKNHFSQLLNTIKHHYDSN